MENDNQVFEHLTPEGLEALVDQTMDLVGVEDSFKAHSGLRYTVRNAVALMRLTTMLATRDEATYKAAGFMFAGCDWQNASWGFDPFNRSALSVENIVYLGERNHLEDFFYLATSCESYNYSDYRIGRPMLFNRYPKWCVKTLKVLKASCGESFRDNCDRISGRLEKYDNVASMPPDLYKALFDSGYSSLMQAMVKEYSNSELPDYQSNA